MGFNNCCVLLKQCCVIFLFCSPLLQLATTNCELELHRSFDLMRFNRNSSSYSETCEKLGCDESGCIAVDCFVSAPVHERYLLSRMAVINEMATDSEQALAYRPPGDGYRSLVIVAENFSKTIANNDTVNSILSSLSMNSLQVSSDSERQCAVQSAENWLQSVRQFCSNLPSQFPQYDDVTGPCVAAAGEVRFLAPVLYANGIVYLHPILSQLQNIESNRFLFLKKKSCPNNGTQVLVT